MCIDVCNHHQNQETGQFHCSSKLLICGYTHPNPWQPLTSQVALLYCFIVLRMPYKHTHMVCNLWRLASFTQTNGSEIHPNGVYQ